MVVNKLENLNRYGIPKVDKIIEDHKGTQIMEDIHNIVVYSNLFNERFSSYQMELNVNIDDDIDYNFNLNVYYKMKNINNPWMHSNTCDFIRYYDGTRERFYECDLLGEFLDSLYGFLNNINWGDNRVDSLKQEFENKLKTDKRKKILKSFK